MPARVDDEWRASRWRFWTQFVLSQAASTWRRCSAGLTGVRWPSLRTSRAATFCTRCRGARVDAGSLNSTELQYSSLLRTSDVTSCFTTSSVTAPRSCRSLLRWKKQVLAILLIYDFNNNMHWLSRPIAKPVQFLTLAIKPWDLYYQEYFLTRNVLDCNQSNYSSGIIFPYTFTQNQTRNVSDDLLRRYDHSKFSKMWGRSTVSWSLIYTYTDVIYTSSLRYESSTWGVKI